MAAAADSTPGTVFTVGHSTRPADELLRILTDASVSVLADVRAFPGSRRHPQFNRSALVEWLPHAGIRYVHMPALGGRRHPISGSPNGGWRETAFQGYADYMSTPEFEAALASLEGLARDGHTAIMCAEAVWWRCHRRLIADALVARGWRVEHLGIGVARQSHTLSDFAVVSPEGRLSYPPVQARLPEA